MVCSHMFSSFHYSLSTVLTILTEKEAIGFESKGFFKSIATSSLECNEGSLFVPLRDKRDGHDFILDALERGASGFLLEKNHPIQKKLSAEVLKKGIPVSNPLESLGKLANFHRSRFKPLIIAVTGSSGKTSTKELLGNLFRYLPSNEIVVTEKNYNNEIGVPFTLFRINEYTKVVICEMGMNQRGEIERLSIMAEPNLSLITNIGSAHVENLKSPSRIALEKSEIVVGMNKGGTLFIPHDISFKKTVTHVAKKYGIHVKTWKNDKSSALKVESETQAGFHLSLQGTELKWNIPGKTLLSNVRGMIEIGNFLGLEKEKISDAIRTFKAPDKRLNIRKGYFQIIDDSYNANPESMISSIQASIQVAGGKPLVLILGTMKELGKYSKMYHDQIGEELKKYPKILLITFGKEAERIAKKRRIGKNQTLPDDFSDFGKIVMEIAQTHPKNTTILIKGSRSMKMERFVESFLAFKT